MTRFRFYEVPATIAPNEPTGGQVQFDSIPGTDIMARKRTSLTRQRIRREAEMITAGLLLQCNQSPIDITASNDVKSRQDEAACLAEGIYGSDGCTLRAAARDILALQGIEPPGEVGRMIIAAMSTSVGGEVFDNVVNRSAMEQYRVGAQSLYGWATFKTDIADFKANKRVRVGVPDSLEKQARGQEAGHLSFDVIGAETYRVHRYTDQFRADEQDLIDDDIGLLATIGTQLGKAAALTFMNLAYAELLGNRTLSDGTAWFHADHGNLNTPAPLSASSLGTAIANMANQTENGQVLDLRPGYLIAPWELDNTVRGVLRDREIDGWSDVQVRCDARLSQGVKDPDTGNTYAGSESTWFLAAKNVPILEIGTRTPEPVIRAFELDQGEWGRAWDVHWDIGVKALDYRGISKNVA